jgi:hypothetical protein
MLYMGLVFSGKSPAALQIDYESCVGADHSVGQRFDRHVRDVVLFMSCTTESHSADSSDTRGTMITAAVMKS